MLSNHDSGDVHHIAEQLQKVVSPNLSKCSWLARHAFHRRIGSRALRHVGGVWLTSAVLLASAAAFVLMASSLEATSVRGAGVTLLAMLALCAGLNIAWRYQRLLRPTGESSETAWVYELIKVSPKCSAYFEVLIGKSESPLYVDLELARCLARQDGVCVPAKPVTSTGPWQLFDHYFGCEEP